MNCECDWKLCHHRPGSGKPVPEAADHGNVTTSPAYCTSCLFVCCADRDDEESVSDYDKDPNVPDYLKGH